MKVDFRSNSVPIADTKPGKVYASVAYGERENYYIRIDAPMPSCFIDLASWRVVAMGSDVDLQHVDATLSLSE